MKTTTRNLILQTSKDLFSINGYEGFSMRNLSKTSGVGLSSIYHFFKDKDEILEELYKTINRELGAERAKLSQTGPASVLLHQRILFQFTHIQEVVFVLKYYLHFRPDYLKLEVGFLPDKAYLHISEILKVGVENGDFAIDISSVDKESKVIAHAINGFLLEYYPNPPKSKELTEVVDSIHEFLMRSLTNKEVLMK